MMKEEAKPLYAVLNIDEELGILKSLVDGQTHYPFRVCVIR
jgi:hypothetical protein